MNGQAAAPVTAGGRKRKRQDVLDGAFTVFARDGYSRASIDAIAAMAGVSTRTVYNHFPDKESLFQAVIVQSSLQISDAQIELTRTHLEGAMDLERNLTALALALKRQKTGFRRHWLLTRQVDAERQHIPASGIEAYEDAGPRRFRRALAAYFRSWTDEGRLVLDDPLRAADHFAALTLNVIQTPTCRIDESDQDDRDVQAAVHVFLYGYATRPPAA